MIMTSTRTSRDARVLGENLPRYRSAGMTDGLSGLLVRIRINPHVLYV